MLKPVTLLTFLAVLLTAWPVSAADWAWLLSVPRAYSGDQVYKVRILEIDSTAQKELLRYAVTPGRHKVKVQMMLEVEWEPELAEAPRGPGWKELELDVVAGKTYQLAAKLNPDAPIEAQLDRSYWEPFVYRVD
jgi:hypothetical protein